MLAAGRAHRQILDDLHSLDARPQALRWEGRHGEHETDLVRADPARGDLQLAQVDVGDLTLQLFAAQHERVAGYDGLVGQDRIGGRFLRQDLLDDRLLELAHIDVAALHRQRRAGDLAPIDEDHLHLEGN